jgi:hypothetical protein
MAKRLNAEIRLIAGDEIQATASHDRAKGEIGGTGEASNGPEEANSTVDMRSSLPLNASARL